MRFRRRSRPRTSATPAGFEICAFDRDGQKAGCITTAESAWLAETPSSHRGPLPYGVFDVWVRTPRRRLGTKLYLQAAREACRRGRMLQSDVERSQEADAFWRKQERKGRAKKITTTLVDSPVDFYRLRCPVPSLSER